jgi:hypothetical protein
LICTDIEHAAWTCYDNDSSLIARAALNPHRVAEAGHLVIVSGTLGLTIAAQSGDLCLQRQQLQRRQ